MVLSDDVGGPDDFTINMEYWMRVKPDERSPTIQTGRTEGTLSWMMRDSQQQPETTTPGAIGEVDAGSKRGNCDPPTKSESENGAPPPNNQDDTHSITSSTLEEHERELSYLSDIESTKSGQLTPKPTGYNVSSILERTDEPKGSPQSTRRHVPASRHATVEDCFSTPAHPAHCDPVHDQPSGNNSWMKDASTSQPLPSDQESRIPTDRETAASENQPAPISNHDNIQPKPQPIATELHKKTVETTLRDQLAATEKQMELMARQFTERERYLMSRVRDEDSDNINKQKQLQDKFEHHQAQIQSRLERTESQLAKKGQMPPPSQEARRQAESRQENLMVRRGQQQSPPFLQLPPTAMRRSVSDSAIIPSPALQDSTPLTPIPNFHDFLDYKPQRSLPTSRNSFISANEPYTAKKLVQILGAPHMPPADKPRLSLAEKERTIKDLQVRLAQLARLNQQQREEFESEKKQMSVDLVRVREELATVKAEEEARNDYLRHELRERQTEIFHNRKNLSDAKREAHIVNERLVSLEADYKRELEDANCKLREAESQRRSLQREVDNSRKAIKELEEELEEQVEECKDRDRELRELRDEKDEAIENIRSNAQDAICKASDALEKEKERRQAAQREVTELRGKSEALGEPLQSNSYDGASDNCDSSIAKPENPTQEEKEIGALRAALEAQTVAAETAQNEARAAQDEVKRVTLAMEAESKVLDSKIAARVNQRFEGMERKFKSVMMAKEKEWEKQNDLLKWEKSRMAKALMRSWGEHEMGERDPQAYRYKFI